MMSDLRIGDPPQLGRINGKQVGHFHVFEELVMSISSPAAAVSGHVPGPEFEPDPLSRRVQATWTAGDFGRIAKGYERGAAEFIARLGLQPGETVLDVACGTGNLSLPAARAGASVTGIDIAPNLIAQAVRNAQNERLRIAFEVGDAERLPYPDGVFRTVVTMFGAMFAARPERASAELLRATRSGGRIAMANWTPTGFIGEMLKRTVRFAPPAAGVPSPLLWGTEAAVRERLGAGAKSLRFARRLITFEYPRGPGEGVEYFRLWYGPTVRDFVNLDERGRLGLRRERERLWTDHNLATDGTTRVVSEYLEVIAVVK
jgi:SAM-dependent methyltransferase